MKSNNIKIGNHSIGKDNNVYIIAEVGVNHEGSMEKAKKLIELSAEGGADAVKFQTYKADTLASKNSPSYWDLNEESTKSQHELFSKFDHFGEKEYIELAEYCRKIGIEFCSTPFDDHSIEFLNPLMQFYKIASADITNIPFIKKIAKKQKPIILSTGASTIEEINYAINVIRNEGCDQIALLHCILNYPTTIDKAHLAMITGLRNSFPEYTIGYSDHTLPNFAMDSLITAFILGARIIEKHFTYDKTLMGNDHYHAMDINDLINFKRRLKSINTILGVEIDKRPIASEEISRKNARRSIVTIKDVKKNTVLTEKHITYKRPGIGISPKHWDSIIGKKVVYDLEEDHILQWDDLESSSTS